MAARMARAVFHGKEFTLRKKDFKNWIENKMFPSFATLA
jgi:hypothetical protein